MKKKAFALLGAGLSLGLGLGYLITSSYYAPFLNSSRLYAENRIERWADNLRTLGEPGRNCDHVNYGDINHVFDSMGVKKLERDPYEMVELSVHCLNEMELVEMKYYADYNVVSGVYRCEKDDMVQELQLTIRLEPRTVPQEDDCKVGAFPKSWNLPVGKVTMFSLP